MIQTKDLHGWPSQILESEGMAVAIPQTIGPRMTHFGPDVATNLFYLKESEKGGTGESDWKLRGGHRLWAAPEERGRTDQPDNAAVIITPDADGSGLTATGPLERATGLVKQIHVRPVANQVLCITHTLENRNLWPIELAPWSLSVFPRGGHALLPLPKARFDAEQKTCSYTLNGWHYTRWHEDCWIWSEEGLALDTSRVYQQQKVGFGGDGCWLAMARDGWLVVKYGIIPTAAAFTDRGAQLHIYADESILELETLGAFASLDPGASVSHRDYITFRQIDTDACLANAWRQAAAVAAELKGFAG